MFNRYFIRVQSNVNGLQDYVILDKLSMSPVDYISGYPQALRICNTLNQQESKCVVSVAKH